MYYAGWSGRLADPVGRECSRRGGEGVPVMQAVRLLLVAAVLACGLAGLHVGDTSDGTPTASFGLPVIITTAAESADPPADSPEAPAGQIPAAHSKAPGTETCIAFAVVVAHHGSPATTDSPAGGSVQGAYLYLPDAPISPIRHEAGTDIGLRLTGVAVRRT